MVADKAEKLKALDAACLQINKQFGAGSLMKLGEQTNAAGINVIPSGSILLDEALGVGGYPRGRVIEMYGPESSGKTTLAKLLIGLYRGEGYINIDGYLLGDYFKDKIGRNFSFCLDEKNPFDIVSDSLAFSLESLQYTKKEIEILIKKYSQIFKIENILDKLIDEISTSDKIKVNIASLLIHKPKIILLDNVLCKLNYNDKKLVIKILKDFQKENKLTIILITNDIQDTLLSDRIIVLDNGKILLDDTPKNIYQDDTVEKMGFELPFIVKLSHNLILYDLLDKVYLTDKGVLDKLWP